MTARISEIEDGIYRLSVYVPEIGAPAGLVRYDNEQTLAVSTGR